GPFLPFSITLKIIAPNKISDTGIVIEILKTRNIYPRWFTAEIIFFLISFMITCCTCAGMMIHQITANHIMVVANAVGKPARLTLQQYSCARNCGGIQKNDVGKIICGFSTNGIAYTNSFCSSLLFINNNFKYNGVWS